MAKRLQAGFTLPELLATGVLFGVLAVVSVFVIRPVDYEAARRNGDRWAGAAQLAHALGDYAKDNGQLPEGVGSETVLIGRDEEMLDLCGELIPGYLDDLPAEPLARLEDANCGNVDNPFITGYAVQQTGDGKFEVSAPLAESNEVIVVSQEF